MTRKMMLDGKFLQEIFKGHVGGLDFSSMGMVGYDAHKGKFVTSQFDNFSTTPMLMQGSYDEDRKTLALFGEQFDDKGKKMKASNVLKILSPDQQVFEMYLQPDGSAEVKVMEIVYTRKK